MSVVIAKSVCFACLDSISLEIVCFTEARIIWFGHPGHHVFSDVVSKFVFILCF